MAARCTPSPRPLGRKAVAAASALALALLGTVALATPAGAKSKAPVKLDGRVNNKGKGTIKNGEVGTLKLALSRTISLELITSHLAELDRLFDRLELRLLRGKAAEIIELLKTGGGKPTALVLVSVARTDPHRHREVRRMFVFGQEQVERLARVAGLDGHDLLAVG